MKVLLSLMLMLAAPFLLTAQTDTSWTEEPDSFRGVKFLSSESEVRAAWETFEIGICSIPKDNEKQCLFSFHLADTFLFGELVFKENGLAEATAVFDPERYAAVLSILVQRYSKSTSSTALRAIWTGKRVSIRLDKNAPKELVEAAALLRLQQDHATALDIHSNALESGTRMHLTAMDFALQIYQISEDEARYEKDKKKAEEEYNKKMSDASARVDKSLEGASQSYDRFKAAKYSSFSIALNEYTALKAKRKVRELSKAASGL
jgi:hypothetical protein